MLHNTSWGSSKIPAEGRYYVFATAGGHPPIARRRQRTILVVLQARIARLGRFLAERKLLGQVDLVQAGNAVPSMPGGDRPICAPARHHNHIDSIHFRCAGHMERRVVRWSAAT